MFCRLCGTEVQDGEEFCEECKNSVKDVESKTKYCTKCGERKKGLENFCLKCGARLEEKGISVKRQIEYKPQKIMEKPKEEAKNKRCKYCYAEIPVGAVHCPICEKMSNIKREIIVSEGVSKKGFVLGFLLGLTAILLIWAFGDDDMLKGGWKGLLWSIGIEIVLGIILGILLA